ncbi:MAG TPA: permease [Solirubrobacteraceae bacterium]|nr:permease [Solirubrobacteraceae bacterium]
MVDVLELLWHGLRNGLLMAWEVWWALVLGFAISAVVQAWVPRGRIERGMAGGGLRPVGIATALGAASSSCSYAAIAIGRSLFAKGASAASSLAFQFASTNLVWELGLVLWVLLGWQFTVGEYLGGIVMIALMALLLRVFVSPRLERQARDHARRAEHVARDHDHHGHHRHGSGDGETDPDRGWLEKAGSLDAWSEVAQNFLGDWGMLYKEIGLGFLIAGFVAELGNGFFSSLFVEHAPAPLGPIENVIVGPLIAVLSFVCSIGNVPLAAVLWSGGISFAGVLAFLFADLIVLPIVAAYRKYYGWPYTVRIVALMFVTMACAALAVDALFDALGLIPSGPRPPRSQVFGGVEADYKLVLNAIALVVFGALMWLSRRGRRRPASSTGERRSSAPQQASLDARG